MFSAFNDLRHWRRTCVLAAVYAAIIAASFYLAYEVRFDFIVPPPYQADRLRYVWLIVLLKLTGLVFAGQFGSLMSYFSIPDLFRLIWATTFSSLILFIFRLPSFVFFLPPRGALLVDYLFCLAGLCAVRLGTRLYRERLSLGKRSSTGPQELIAIMGAGDVGAALAREFVNAPGRGFKPVVFFDDNKAKYGQMVHGVPVVGPPPRVTKQPKWI